ncbi:hypothetical protein PR003_g33196, partial [Phytophthora rubi]
MASFEPGTASSGPAPGVATPPGINSIESSAPDGQLKPDVLSELRLLKEEVLRLRGMVGRPSPRVEYAATPSGLTAPNAKGELPPSELRYLTSSTFPEGSKKGKGDYNPPQAHLLAASRMFRTFGTDAGKPLSAMSFVLSLRELDCVKFRATPAVLMAIFSGRLGSRGLTIMHFKESSEMASLEDGSSNANFASDFSASAQLPPASISCRSYEEILDALHGLNSLGQEVWYDHLRKLTSRLRTFVSSNKSADPLNTPARVRLTLLYVNKFVGAALGFMQVDDPQWWHGFCEALRSIDYQSPIWTMALLGVLTQGPTEDGRQPTP